MASYSRYTTKSGEKLWMVQLSIGKDPKTGKYRSTTRRGFKTKREAMEAARLIQNEVEEGKFIQKEYFTFEEVYDMWMKEQEKKLKISSLANKRSKFNKHILPNFRKLYIDQITSEQCQAFIDELSTKMKSFKDYGNQMDLLFRYSKRKKIIKENPMDYVAYPYYEDEYSSKEEDTGVEFWEKETVNTFLTRAEQELSFRVFAMFRTFLYTGIRKGELSALLESDLCQDKKELSIDKTLVWINGDYQLLQPKTKNSFRKIGLDDKTFNVLVKLIELNRRLREEHGNPNIEPFLFPRPSDLKPMRSAYPNETLHSTCKRFKIKNIKVHGLRHTHASMLFAAGARMKDIQKRLGHSRISTTMDIYTHISEKADGELSKKLVSFLNNEDNENQDERI